MVGFIRSNYGSRGNFEVVVPHADGGLIHFYRANDESGYPWRSTDRFGGSARYGAVALIQSNYGSRGNFEVVAQRGDQLVHYHRANDESGQPWRGGTVISSDVGPRDCIRVHFKTLVARTAAIDTFINTQFNAMLALFAGSNINCIRGTTEDLSANAALANLRDLDVGNCLLGVPTAEHNALFANRNNAAADDLVIYIVRSLVDTIPPASNFLGCATHPNNIPGAAIVQTNAAWLLAHEIGHVLGLRHVPMSPSTNSDFLMFPNVGWTNTPPNVTAAESSTMRQSAFIVAC